MEKNIKEKRKEQRLRKKHKGEGQGGCDIGSKREQEDEETALEEEVILDN